MTASELKTRERLSVLIASRNRPEELERCIESVVDQQFDSIEIIVLDDGSDHPLKESLAEDFDRHGIRWLRNEEPAGVSGARNRLVENAGGSILVFIDDDAHFTNSNSLELVCSIFDEDERLGILAFKIHLFDKNSQELQVPFSRKTIRHDSTIVDRAREVGYFVGAGHAIRREVFEECGSYPTDFVYGHEELDLTYRAVNSGFRILYTPSIVVVHSPAKSQISGNGQRDFEAYYSTRNRIWLAYRNLPLRYGVVYSVAWSFYYFLMSIRHGGAIDWMRAVKDGLLGLRGNSRQPLSSQAVQYFARHGGRLWR